MSILDTLHRLLAERILVLDGAMGTMVQRRRLSEADFRGERFKRHPRDLKVTLGARRTNDPFAVLLAIGTKSASARTTRRELRRDGAPSARQR